MNHFLKTLLFLSTVFIFASCQRDFLPEENPIIPVPVTGDSALLLRYVEIDSVPGSGSDTTQIVKFEYDAQKRLSILYTYYSTDPADNLINYEKFVYQYSGNDTLPSRMIYDLKMDDGTNVNIEKDTAYYTYNAAGKLIVDSTSRNHAGTGGSTHYYTKRAYSYFGNFFTVQNRDDNNGSPEFTFDTVYVTGTGNNISSLSFAEYSLPDSMESYRYNSSFTYDNQPNPFYNIPALYPTLQVFGFESSPVGLLQKNNPLSLSQTSSYSAPSTENIVYGYNANGYPAVFYSTYISDDGSGMVETRYYKGLFSYN